MYKRYLNNQQLIQSFAIRIIWVYSECQQDYGIIRLRYPDIEFHKVRLNEIFDLYSPDQRNILVLDDQMGVASSSNSVADLHQKTLP